MSDFSPSPLFRAPVPSERQGGHRGPGEGEAPLRSGRPAKPRYGPARLLGGLKKGLQSIDPRLIEGPRLPLIALGLWVMLGSWDGAALVVLLPEIRADFGLSLAFLGVLSSAVGMAGVLGGPLLGHLADRWKRVRMIQIGAVGSQLSSVWAGLAPRASHFAGSRVADSLAGLVAGPAALPLLSDYYPAGSRVRVFAYLSAAGRAGALAGPVVAGFLAAKFGWRAALVALAFTGLLAALATFALKEPRRGQSDEHGPSGIPSRRLEQRSSLSLSESWRRSWGILTVRRLAFATPFLEVLPAAAAIFPIYWAERFLMGPVERGSLVTFTGLVGLLGLLAAPSAADRLLLYRPGRVITVVAGLVAFEVVMLVGLALSPWRGISIAFYSVYGLIGAILAPMLAALIALIVPAMVRGLALQILAPWRLPGLVAAPFVLMAADAWGLDKALLLLAPFSAVAAIIVLSAAPLVARDVQAAEISNRAEELTAKPQAGVVLSCFRLSSGSRDCGLQDVTLEVSGSEVVSLIASDGSGSRLLRAVAGLEPVSMGVIALDGRDVTYLKPPDRTSRGIVLVASDGLAVPGLTVEENLLTALRQSGRPARPDGLQPVLHIVPQLRGREQVRAGDLSEDDQFALSLAQALLLQPRVLLIEQPAGGLSKGASVGRVRAAAEAATGSGAAVIVAHRPGDVLDFATRAVALEGGRVTSEGAATAGFGSESYAAPTMLISAPRKTFTKAGGADQPAGAAALEVAGVPLAEAPESVLRVQRGEIIAAIAEEAAGRELAQLVCGFAPARGRRVLLGPTDVSSMAPARRARMGLAWSYGTTQRCSSLTPSDAVAIALRSPRQEDPGGGGRTGPTRNIDKLAYELLEEYGVGKEAGIALGALSPGSRCLTQIACARARRASALVISQPFTGLSGAEFGRTAWAIRKLAGDLGTGILIVGEQAGRVEHVCDRVISLQQAAGVRDGP